MCLAHPKIDSDTVRIRLVGHGDSSFDIEIRVYALTREWMEFYAIREDVLLRVTEIVDNAGTGFAFPSRTMYMAADDGMDDDRSGEILEEVKTWRASGSLPFPTMDTARRERLSGTLDYPPRGSHGARQRDQADSDHIEPLSSEPEDEPKQ